MNLDLVQIQNFRNLDSVSLNPSPNVNFLFGQNGSGKSSILEAIHYLGFGRSFRTSKHKNVIQNECDAFSVFTKCIPLEENYDSFGLGLSRDIHDQVTISINGQRSNKMSELVKQIPVQIFTPQSTEMIIGSPGLRRKYLDWGLFHVEHSFEQISNHYKRLLKHKNAMLKKQSVGGVISSNESDFWDTELAKAGETFTQYRKSFLERLKPHIYANLEQFLPEISLEISYHRGWEKDVGFNEAISKKLIRDIKQGFLSIGPHKADVKFKVGGVDASEVLSRGQLRMLVAALQLAETQCLLEETSKTCIFLLDDVGAELDVSKREKFIDTLLNCNAQLFVTAIEKEQVMFIDKYKNKKLFHVEHGQVREEI